MLGACAAPLIYFVARRTGAILAIFAIQFAVYYPAPVLMLHRVQTNNFPSHDLPDYLTRAALELSLASFVCICLGYYLIPKNACLIPRFEFAWSNPGVIRMTAAAMCAVGMVASFFLYLHRGEGPSQFVALSSNLLMFGVAVLFTLQLLRKLSPLYALVLWGMFIPARLMIGLSSGATAAALSVGLVLLVVYCELRGRMWWSAIVVGFLAVLVLRPLMTPFRELTGHHGAEAGVTGIERLAVFGHVATRAVQGRYGDYDHLEQFAAKRLCLVCTFADVIRQTPDIVPYWEGATYFPILFKLIPRLLWPDKPPDDTGQAFGHRYGFLALTDFETAFNLPQTVEMYANFGAIGVIIGSFLLGLLYRFAELTFFHPRSGIGAVAIGAVVLSNLLAIEAGASAVVGGYIIAMIIVFPVALVVDAAELWSDSSRWQRAA